MAAPVFVEAEYADPPCTGLETHEADGTWLGCTAYTHAARGNVVLWYGGETYEGLGGGYRWGGRGAAGGAPRAGAVRGAGPAPGLLDGDGDVVLTRWVEVFGGHAPSPAVVVSAAATTTQSSSRFLPFGEALAVARSLGLASSTEWQVWSKEGLRPSNVPSDPPKVYKDHGWQGWGHWLGSSNLQTKLFLPFAEALAVARSLRLASQFEWKVWSKEGLRPADVPAKPDKVYRDHGWRGWGHWLGTGNQHTKNFLPFGEALAVARSLNLASSIEWQVWSKEGLRPASVPSVPSRVYKDHGWQGWGHWLGTGNLQTKLFLPFKEALAVARSLRLASQFEWRVWSKEGLRPANMPSNPDKFYRDHGWQGWGHWLSSNNLHTKLFLPFEEALAVARSLGLASMREWKVWSKEGLRPTSVPAIPNKVYKDHGWQGWGHWLGTGKTSGGQVKGFLPFDEALCAARQLRLVSRTEWRLWCKSGARPANMPSNPNQVYVHDGWMGWVHWLCHANLDPPTTPAVAPSTRKRAAPGRTSSPGGSRGKRRRC